MDIWEKYEKSKSYMQKKGIKTGSERNWKFYIGKQWEGTNEKPSVDTEDLPMQNFIKPTIKYKVATIAQNNVTAIFSDMNPKHEDYTDVCDRLSKIFDICWERSKMNRIKWKAIQHCAITGDSYCFWYDGDTRKTPQIILNTQIHLGDENQTDIQNQPYIIIEERLSLKQIKEIAKANGISKEEINEITTDSDTTEQLLNTSEVSDKVTSLLYMEKKDGIVHIARATKSVVYEELHPIQQSKGGKLYGKGLTLYPMASMVWEEVPNTARGVSEVEQLISNQICVNKTLARRAMSIKTAAFPRLAYDASLIDNPEDIDKVGGKIKINSGGAQSVQSLIGYLNPASQSADAKIFSDEMIDKTKDLAGASDTAMGNINPARVSGTAITAIRDQQQLPLNDQVAMYNDFVENVALLWFELWRVYNPNGLEIDGIEVSQEELSGVLPNVRIDVSESNTWSRMTEQQEISNLFNNGKLTLEEYAMLSPEHSSVPKQKLLEVIAKRKEQEQLQQEQMMQAQQEQQGEQPLEESIDNSVPQEDIPDQNVEDGANVQNIQSLLQR